MKKTTSIFMSILLVFGMLFGSITTVLAEAASYQGELTVYNGSDVLVETVDFTFDQGDTAYDVLTSETLESVLDVGITYHADFGAFIDSFNGVEQYDDKYWSFYVNGIQTQTGITGYPVRDGDHLTFHLLDFDSTQVNTATLSALKDDENLVTIDYPISFIPELEPTAFDLLLTTLGEENVDYTYFDGVGYFVDSILGNTAEGTYFWAFYVGETSQDVGASSYVLQNNDDINFKYVSWANEDSDDDTSTDDGDGETEYSDDTHSTQLDKALIDSSIESAKNYVMANYIGDWEAIALSKLGYTDLGEYLERVKQEILEVDGEYRNITDTARRSLGILAAGGDPTNVEGYNLIEKIYNGTNITRQGHVGTAFSLIALDSGDFNVPEDAEWTRERILHHLLENQQSDGGWTWASTPPSDLDFTAMILTALAPYESDPEVQGAIDAAVDFLSESFLDGKINNSSTAAQMVIAFSTLGLDSHTFYNQNGDSLIEYLLTFQDEDGGFGWQDNESDGFSTDQAFRGVVAYYLFTEGKSSLYAFNFEEDDEETEQPDDPSNDEDSENGEDPTNGEDPIIEDDPSNGDDETEDPKNEEDQKNEVETPNREDTTDEDELTNGEKPTTGGNSSNDDNASNEEKLSNEEAKDAEESEEEAAEKTNENGDLLPNTATISYNLLAIGLVILLIGAASLVVTRKKRFI
ncbi:MULTISPECIES: DUF4430 domain-containing protein [Bacillaceae]|uniref:DUF4430 domain-containing protein n=1 Tax=Evansella alkalicola TaxID=745819 RepID=A0ABS6JXP8_9BACI|nr:MULTISPECIES: DUF4430 domain-containing protein [Bacillaceae]MBU9723371.1 DUF4430 domain-containing protein [Bacillus alkalicola]